MPTVSYDNEKTEFHITFTKEEFSEGGALASLGKNGEQEKTYTINFKDIAGNDQKKEFKLKVDRKLPTLTVTVTVDTSPNFDNKKIVTKNGITTYYLKASDKFNINIKSDKVLDLTKVRFKKKDTDEDGIIVNKNVKINNDDDDDDKEYNITVTVPSSNGSKNLINQLLDFKIFNIKDTFARPNIISFDSSNIINSDNIHIDNVAPDVRLGTNNGGLTEFLNPTDSSKPVTITFHSDEEGYIKNKGNINYFSKLNNTGIDFSTNNSLVVKKKENILEFTGNTSDFTWTNNSTYKNTEIIIRDYAGNESTLTLPDFIVDTTPPKIVNGVFTLSLNVNGSNKESEYNRVSKDEVTYINRKSKLRLSVEFNEKIKNPHSTSFAVKYNTTNTLEIENLSFNGANDLDTPFTAWGSEYYKYAEIEFAAKDEVEGDTTSYEKKISSIDIELIDIAGNQTSDNAGITSLSLSDYKLFSDVRIPKITVTNFYTSRETSLGYEPLDVSKAKDNDQINITWQTNVHLDMTNIKFDLINITSKDRVARFNRKYTYDENDISKEYTFSLSTAINKDQFPEGKYTYSITDIKSISGNTSLTGVEGDINKKFILIDRTRKEISQSLITSDNNINESYATIGNTITLTFTVKEKIQTPIITINKLQLVPIPQNTSNTTLKESGGDDEGQDQIWTLTHKIPNSWDSKNHDGQLQYTIKYEDEIGNKGDDYTQTSNITIMTTKPEITDAYVTHENWTKIPDLGKKDEAGKKKKYKLGAGEDIYIVVEFNREVYLDQGLINPAGSRTSGGGQTNTRPELVLSNGGIATLVQNNSDLRESDKTKLYFTYHIRNDPEKNKDDTIKTDIKDITIEKLKLNNEKANIRLVQPPKMQPKYGQYINDAAGNSLEMVTDDSSGERSITFADNIGELFVEVEIIPFKVLIALSQDPIDRTTYDISFMSATVDTETVPEFLLQRYTTEVAKVPDVLEWYWNGPYYDYIDDIYTYYQKHLSNTSPNSGDFKDGNTIKIQYDSSSKLDGVTDTSFYIRKKTGNWKDAKISNDRAPTWGNAWYLKDADDDNKNVGIIRESTNTFTRYEVSFGSASEYSGNRITNNSYNLYGRWRIKVPQGAFNDGTVYKNENMKSNYRLGNDPTNEDTDEQGWYEVEPLYFYIRPRVKFLKVVGKLEGTGESRSILRLEISDPNVQNAYAEKYLIAPNGWLEMYWRYDKNHYESVTTKRGGKYKPIYNNVYITKPYNVIIGDDETPKRNAGTVKVWDIVINAKAHNGVDLSSGIYSHTRWAFRVKENVIETNLWKKNEGDGLTNLKSDNELYYPHEKDWEVSSHYDRPTGDEDGDYFNRFQKTSGPIRNASMLNGFGGGSPDEWYIVTIEIFWQKSNSEIYRSYINNFNEWPQNRGMWYNNNII